MEKTLEKTLSVIINKISIKTKNLHSKTKLLLISSVLIFIASKILSLLKFNIPGLGVLAPTLILLAIGLEQFKKYHANKQKINLILGSIFLGLSTLIFGCFIIIYPFIIISTILL